MIPFSTTKLTADGDRVSEPVDPGEPVTEAQRAKPADRRAPEPHTTSDDGRGSCRRVDFTEVLAGRDGPPAATVPRRTDGIGLFCPRRVRTVVSQPEAGKPWLAITRAGELRAGHAGEHVDVKDDVDGVVGRLLAHAVRNELIRNGW